MKFATNMVLQALALITSSGTLLTDFVPEKYKVPVVAAVSVAQWVIAKVAHNSNPDGTDAEFAYQRK